MGRRPGGRATGDPGFTGALLRRSAVALPGFRSEARGPPLLSDGDLAGVASHPLVAPAAPQLLCVATQVGAHVPSAHRRDQCAVRSSGVEPRWTRQPTTTSP